MLPHPLTNLKIQRSYQNEPRFNGLYFCDTLPNKIKDEEYALNLDEYTDTGIHWITLHSNSYTKTYFDRFWS